MTQQLLLDLACPKCSQLLEVGSDQLKCNHCLQEWPIKKGIPQFVQSPYYWGELPADLMKEVNEFACNHGLVPPISRIRGSISFSMISGVTAPICLNTMRPD